MKRMGPSVQAFFDGMVVVLFVGVLAALGAQLLAGCKATCAALDLAAQSCPAVVEYVDEYGSKRTTTMTNDDARELAAIKAARRDAGVEAGQ